MSLNKLKKPRKKATIANIPNSSFERNLVKILIFKTLTSATVIVPIAVHFTPVLTCFFNFNFYLKKLRIELITFTTSLSRKPKYKGSLINLSLSIVVNLSSSENRPNLNPPFDECNGT